MTVLYIILFLAVLFGIVYVWQKVEGAVNKAASKKSLLLINPLIFETSAPAQVIIQQLAAHVQTTSSSSPYKAVVYQSSRNANQITYAYGNRFESKMFEAVLLCTPRGTGTECVLRVPSWREQNGIIIGQELLKRLRMQVWEAFLAADPSVRVTETPAGSER